MSNTNNKSNKKEAIIMSNSKNIITMSKEYYNMSDSEKVQAITNIMSEDELTGTEKNVMTCIILNASKFSCKKSNFFFADMLGFTYVYISRVIGNLIKKGYLDPIYKPLYEGSKSIVAREVVFTDKALKLFGTKSSQNTVKTNVYTDSENEPENNSSTKTNVLTDNNNLNKNIISNTSITNNIPNKKTKNKTKQQKQKNSNQGLRTKDKAKNQERFKSLCSLKEEGLKHHLNNCSDEQVKDIAWFIHEKTPRAIQKLEDQIAIIRPIVDEYLGKMSLETLKKAIESLFRNKSYKELNILSYKKISYLLQDYKPEILAYSANCFSFDDMFNDSKWD